MADVKATFPATPTAPAPSAGRPKLDHEVNPLAGILFIETVGAGVLYELRPSAA